MVAALKIIATGASAVVGISISQAIAASGLGTIPVVGELLSTFAGVFATGALSCTLLYALDSCDIVQQIVGILNKVRTIDYDIAFLSPAGRRLLKFLCSKTACLRFWKVFKKTNSRLLPILHNVLYVQAIIHKNYPTF